MTTPGPTRADLARLLRWRPRHGVVSIYLDLAPGDRGEAWRIELRNGLRTAQETAQSEAERETRIALEATIERIKERFGDGGRPDGRTHVGFVEAGSDEHQRWYSLALALGEAKVVHGPRPLLHPLLSALDHGAPRGVLAVSSERVRVFDWALGEIEEIDDLTLELFIRDWRERKSPRSADPARAQGPTASGRDQFEQRMDANRERFLRQVGQVVASRAADRGWREIDVFADEQHFQPLAAGFGNETALRHVDHRNVISQPVHVIAERLAALLPEVVRERESKLVARVRGEAGGGTRGALGLEETFQALLEGRVEHLLIDPGSNYEIPSGSPLAASADPELPLTERMIELALSTSASVTPLEREAADELVEHGGIAALLRY